MNALGSLFFGTMQQYEQAQEWFKKSAELGFTPAKNNLGICYEFGYGLAKDVEIALKLYREAAEKGHVQAMYNLGCLLFK